MQGGNCSALKLKNLFHFFLLAGGVIKEEFFIFVVRRPFKSQWAAAWVVGRDTICCVNRSDVPSAQPTKIENNSLAHHILGVSLLGFIFWA